MSVAAMVSTSILCGLLVLQLLASGTEFIASRVSVSAVTLDSRVSLSLTEVCLLVILVLAGEGDLVDYTHLE